jgi:hypothetical protein
MHAPTRASWVRPARLPPLPGAGLFLSASCERPDQSGIMRKHTYSGLLALIRLCSISSPRFFKAGVTTSS